jgi:hypothetical protein
LHTNGTPSFSWVRRGGTSTIALIAFVAFVVAATSCGADVAHSVTGNAELSASHAAAGSTRSETWTLRPVTHSVTYPGFEATLDPPGTAKPNLTPAEAVALCSQPGSDVSCETGQPSSIELGLLSDSGMGIDRLLVWAMSWDGVNCMLMGPDGRPSPGPGVNDTSGCNFVTFVGATTGTNPMAIRGAGI